MNASWNGRQEATFFPAFLDLRFRFARSSSRSPPRAAPRSSCADAAGASPGSRSGTPPVPRRGDPRPGRYEVDARLDPLRALARGENRGLGGRLERLRQGWHFRGLLVQPRRIAGASGLSIAASPATGASASASMDSSRFAERCPLAGRRRDRGGRLVAGQPGRLQPVGAPLALAEMCVNGDVAARWRAATGSGTAAAGGVPRRRHTKWRPGPPAGRRSGRTRPGRPARRR